MSQEEGGICMSREWIDDFVEKISKIEGHFDLYCSAFLKYENQFIFGLQDSKDWFIDNDRKKASLSVFGGRLEEGIDPVIFLQNHFSQELGVNIHIKDSPHTYIDYQHRLKRLPIHSVKGKIRPYMITVIQKARYAASSNMLIFSYLGESRNKPHSMNYSALLLVREKVLVQMFKTEKSVQDLKKAGALFIERIKIPDDLFLYPIGSLNSLLRYLNYEVF